MDQEDTFKNDMRYIEIIVFTWEFLDIYIYNKVKNSKNVGMFNDSEKLKKWLFSHLERTFFKIIKFEGKEVSLF